MPTTLTVEDVESRPLPTVRLAVVDGFARVVAGHVKAVYAIDVAICVVMMTATALILNLVMPDGADVAGTAEFYANHYTLLKGVSVILTVMFIVAAFWSAAFVGTLWRADKSRNHFLSWSAFISDMLVLGLFFVEAGIFAATVLLSQTTSPEIIHALHVTALVSAAILGPVWIPFTWSALMISRRYGLFPKWLNKVCVVVIVVDICTLTGVFTLTGPLNGMNGMIGAFAGVLSPVIWVAAVFGWELVEWSKRRVTETPLAAQ